MSAQSRKDRWVGTGRGWLVVGWGMAPVARPFHPSDMAGIYRLCLLTGEAGGDASGLYRDPDLLAHVYAGPYPVADPSLTWVVADDHGVAGYVVATADSPGFARWLEEHWWPVLRAQHPLVEDPRDGTQDHVLIERIHASRAAPEPQFHEFPAHLHIDLHPRVQGQGWGRRLIGTLADALRARDVPGVHLGVDDRNTGAQAFYARLGFQTFATHEWGRTLALRL